MARGLDVSSSWDSPKRFVRSAHRLRLRPRRRTHSIASKDFEGLKKRLDQRLSPLSVFIT